MHTGCYLKLLEKAEKPTNVHVILSDETKPSPETWLIVYNGNTNYRDVLG